MTYLEYFAKENNLPKDLPIEFIDFLGDSNIDNEFLSNIENITLLKRAFMAGRAYELKRISKEYAEEI